MVTITMQLEVPDRLAAEDFAGTIREKCDTEGWRVIAFEYADGEAAGCPECGRPMAYDSMLQAPVCHHEE